MEAAILVFEVGQGKRCGANSCLCEDALSTASFED